MVQDKNQATHARLCSKHNPGLIFNLTRNNKHCFHTVSTIWSDLIYESPRAKTISESGIQSALTYARSHQHWICRLIGSLLQNWKGRTKTIHGWSVIDIWISRFNYTEYWIQNSSVSANLRKTNSLGVH